MCIYTHSHTEIYYSESAALAAAAAAATATTFAAASSAAASATSLAPSLQASQSLRSCNALARPLSTVRLFCCFCWWKKLHLP